MAATAVRPASYLLLCFRRAQLTYSSSHSSSDQRIARDIQIPCTLILLRAFLAAPRGAVVPTSQRVAVPRGLIPTCERERQGAEAGVLS